MKKIAIPLVLLASISTLTSCANKTVAPTEVTPVPTEVTPVAPTPAPVVPAPVEAPVAPTPEMASGTTSAPVTKTGTVSYNSPAGSETIDLSVSFEDGVLTSVTVTPKATNDISKKLQTAFAGEISTKVVGKKISELNLSAVGGASLTTTAFNSFIKAL